MNTTSGIGNAGSRNQAHGPQKTSSGFAAPVIRHMNSRPCLHTRGTLASERVKLSRSAPLVYHGGGRVGRRGDFRAYGRVEVLGRPEGVSYERIEEVGMGTTERDGRVTTFASVPTFLEVKIIFLAVGCSVSGIDG